jgi:hypothetical protein
MIEKTRIIERKLQEANMKGQKPSIDAIAQGFQPSQKSLATQVKLSLSSFSFSSTIHFENSE